MNQFSTMEEWTFRDWWLLFRPYRWRIIAWGIAAAVVAGAVTLIALPRRYVSSAVLLLPTDQSTPSPAQRMMPALPGVVTALAGDLTLGG